MMRLRTTSGIFRSLLALGLVLTVVAKSTVGAAIVLHRHGSFGAHWHVLASADLGQNAAQSSEFGHQGKRPSALHATPRPVQTLTVVGVGLIYIPVPRDAQIDSQEATSTCLYVTLPCPGINNHSCGHPVTNPPTRFAVRHADAILLGSHAFLI